MRESVFTLERRRGPQAPSPTSKAPPRPEHLRSRRPNPRVDLGAPCSEAVNDAPASVSTPSKCAAKPLLRASTVTLRPYPEAGQLRPSTRFLKRTSAATRRSARAFQAYLLFRPTLLPGPKAFSGATTTSKRPHLRSDRPKRRRASAHRDRPRSVHASFRALGIASQ